VAAFQLARTMAGGRVALGEVTQANRSVPNMGNTPYGNIMVAHLLLQDNTRQIDRDRYVAEQGSRGVDPVRAQSVFDQVNPPDRYVVAAAAGAVRQAFPGSVTYLQQHPTPAVKADFDKRYGTGVADMILGGGS